MNKKVRESYVRGRLLTTHHARERLSQSEFNIDQMASIAVIEGQKCSTELMIPSIHISKEITTNDISINFSNTNNLISTKEFTVTQEQECLPTCASSSAAIPNDAQKNASIQYKDNMFSTKKNRTLTIHNIEKEHLKPLSKYDRNMMIFNWLDGMSTFDEFKN